jgi:hypothetical protein
MALAHDIQAALEAKNVRLRQLEAAYIRAKDFLKSLEWQKTRDFALQSIQEVTATYQGKDATEAVFILGKIKIIMLDIQEPTDVIIEYEGLKRELDNYHAARNEGPFPYS